MGNARWSPDDWTTYTKATAHKPHAAVFTSRGMHADLDPKTITVRESVDSDANPASTPIIVALDVTGSMGEIPDQLIRGPLGTFIEEVLARKPVSDPHLMFMGVGDVSCDQAPLQVTQFEADDRIAKEMAKIFIERGGGGNRTESYQLPWYFAAMKTRIDSLPKRGKKGYLFTVGDEEAPGPLSRDELFRVTGETAERDYTAAELLALAEQSYHVFHIVVEEGSHARTYRDAVFGSWQKLLGQRVIPLSDKSRLAEVLVSTIQANEGVDRHTVAKSWSDATALVVARAIGHLTPAQAAHGGLVRL